MSEHTNHEQKDTQYTIKVDIFNEEERRKSLYRHGKGKTFAQKLLEYNKLQK